MKELSIEEKAKRYDEAIEVARKIKNNDPINVPDGTLIPVAIFPELKESEDEQHRKWILEYLYDGLRKSDEQFKDQFKAAIAWLEKQKERSPLSKDEEYTLARIIEYLEDNDCPSEWKDLLHDIYALPYQKEKNPAWSEEDETALGDALWCCKQAASIAKNENDMGNVWYAETWLKSLKDRVLPKQEWSEEDESRRKKIIHILSLDGRIKNEELSDINNWLKSLRPQNKWKPSDEQMDNK